MKDVLLILLAMLGWYLFFLGFSFVLFKWFFPLYTQKEIKFHTAQKENKLPTRKQNKQRTLYAPPT